MKRSHTPALPGPQPRHKERLYGLWQALLGLLRERWFQLAMRDGLLFLALVLTLLGLDSATAIWLLWWPLPLAAVAGGMTLYLHPYPFLRWRHLGWFSLFLFACLLRAIYSINGPIPAAGLREAQDLMLILMAAASLWLLSCSDPRRALRLWVGAMALGWLATWSRAHADGVHGPVQSLTGLMMVWGSLLLIRQHHGTRPGRPVGALPPGPGTPIRAADLCTAAFFGAGLIIGWYHYLHQARLPIDVALPLEAGLRAQETLWIHSLLIGWGHGTLDRLIEVLAEPRIASIAAWGGPIGILALGGIAGELALIILGLVLWWRCRRFLGRLDTSPIRLPAILTALVMLGVLQAGGPRSGAALFILAGWVALALTDPVTRSGFSREAFSKARSLPLATAAVGAGLCILLMALPLLGRAIEAGTHGPRGFSEAARQQLDLARQLNPFDPAIPMAQADALRETSSGIKGWSPSLYLRVVRLYQEAEALDPYQTEIPRKLAEFQLQNDRQEEAIDTARRALSRRPNSQALMTWTFETAERLELNTLAYQILDHGLIIMPMQSGWWQKQYLLARRLGQGPLASQSLAVALTANPESDELVKACWHNTRPAVSLPGETSDRSTATPPATK